MATSFGARFWEPTGGNKHDSIPGIGWKQDGLGLVVGAARAASSSGLRANISSAIVKGRIPRATREPRYRDVLLVTSSSGHRLHRRTIREFPARFAVASRSREDLHCQKESSSVALRICQPGTGNVWGLG